jgi:hypothetical protein
VKEITEQENLKVEVSTLKNKGASSVKKRAGSVKKRSVFEEKG